MEPSRTKLTLQIQEMQRHVVKLSTTGIKKNYLYLGRSYMKKIVLDECQCPTLDKEKDVISRLLFSWEIFSSLGSWRWERSQCALVYERTFLLRSCPTMMSFTLQVAEILIGLVMLCLGVTISPFPRDYEGGHSMTTKTGYHLWGSLSVSIRGCFSVGSFSGVCDTSSFSLEKPCTAV